MPLETALRESLKYDWLTLVLVIALIMLVFARYFYPDRFRDFTRILRTETYVTSGLRKTTTWHPFNVLVSLVQVIGIALALYLLYIHFNGKSLSKEPLTFLQILIGYLMLLFGKGMIEYVLTFILGMNAIFETYFFKKLSYRNGLGILLVLISPFLIYNETFRLSTVYVIAGLAGIFLLFFGYSMIDAYRKQILSHPFYFILYFCTLEIAPYYILYKVIEF